MGTNSGKIGDICTHDPASWKDKIFLTIDIDWAHDEILEDTIQLIEDVGICATWFVTRAIALCILLVTGMAEEDGITVIQVIGHA
jgi:hypothetical protein